MNHILKYKALALVGKNHCSQEENTGCFIQKVFNCVVS